MASPYPEQQMPVLRAAIAATLQDNRYAPVAPLVLSKRIATEALKTGEITASGEGRQWVVQQDRIALHPMKRYPVIMSSLSGITFPKNTLDSSN